MIGYDNADYSESQQNHEIDSSNMEQEFLKLFRLSFRLSRGAPEIQNFILLLVIQKNDSLFDWILHNYNSREAPTTIKNLKPPKKHKGISNNQRLIQINVAWETVWQYVFNSNNIVDNQIINLTLFSASADLEAMSSQIVNDAHISYLREYGAGNKSTGYREIDEFYKEMYTQLQKTWIDEQHTLENEEMSDFVYIMYELLAVWKHSNASQEFF